MCVYVLMVVVVIVVVYDLPRCWGGPWSEDGKRGREKRHV